MQEEYHSTLIPSCYQGYISGVVNYMMKKLNRADFESWRMHGDIESKARIERLMSKTEYWQHREEDILPRSGSPRSYDVKREIISGINSPRLKGFFTKYETIYFPDISQMTPLEKIDNVLTQKYNIGQIEAINMGMDSYSKFLHCLGYEGYSLINQAADLKAKDELANVIGNIRLSEVNAITQETKALVVDPKEEKKGKWRKTGR